MASAMIADVMSHMRCALIVEKIVVIVISPVLLTLTVLSKSSMILRGCVYVVE